MRALFLILLLTAGFSFLGQAQSPPPASLSLVEELGIELRDGKVDFESVLILYAHLTGRTVLQHPLLKPFSLSLTNSSDKAQQIAALKESFRLNGITTILDGEKFVMVVPTALTNSAVPRSREIVAGNADDLIPVGMLNLQRTPLQQVVEIYAGFLGRRFDSPEDCPPMVFISFRMSNPLSRSEIRYGLDTVLAWNGVKVVPTGENSLKVEVVPSGRR